MSDYIDSLEQALRTGAAREYGAPSPLPPRRSDRRRWSALVVAVAVILAGGSAAGAITALVDTGSAPLTGTAPGITAQLLRYDIPITPDLEPGDAGWCSYPIFSIRHGITDAAGGGTCSPAGAPDSPVILGGGVPISNERDLLRQAGGPLDGQQGKISLFWMVVSSRVGAVLLRRGDVVTSRADPRLPAGWRAAVAFVHGLASLSPMPLDRSGHPIIQRATTLSRIDPGSGGVAAARSYEPAGDAASPCAIRAVRLPSVTAQWEVVARTAPALGSAVGGNVLFSCARSWFSVRGQSQAPSAAILLDAQDPRRRAPSLPGLTPTDHPGVFTNPSAEIVAKRIGRGWLVVQAQSVPLGKTLLSALRVKGSSLAPAPKP